MKTSSKNVLLRRTIFVFETWISRLCHFVSVFSLLLKYIRDDRFVESIFFYRRHSFVENNTPVMFTDDWFLTKKFILELAVVPDTTVYGIGKNDCRKRTIWKSWSVRDGYYSFYFYFHYRFRFFQISTLWSISNYIESLNISKHRQKSYPTVTKDSTGFQRIRAIRMKYFLNDYR